MKMKFFLLLVISNTVLLSEHTPHHAVDEDLGIPEEDGSVESGNVGGNTEKSVGEYSVGSICWYCKECSECASYKNTRLKHGSSHPRHNAYTGVKGSGYCSLCYHLCDPFCYVGSYLDVWSVRVYSLFRGEQQEKKRKIKHYF